MSAARRGTPGGALALAVCLSAVVLVATPGRACDTPSPADDAADSQTHGARYHQVIQDFCAADFGPAAVVEYFAPGATDVDAGGVLLYPGLAHHSSHNNHRIGVVNTQAPPIMVVSWMRPGVGRPVSELTVHTTYPGNIPYRSFIEEYALPPEAEWTQDGHLSDIVHRHVVTCGDREIDVLLHEAVWSGDSVGKLTQFTVRRNLPDEAAVDPVDAALQARVPAIKECVGEKHPGGFVTVEFQLTPQGKITELKPTSEADRYPGLDECIAGELEQIVIEPCDLEVAKPMEYWLSFFG